MKHSSDKKGIHKFFKIILYEKERYCKMILSE